VKKADMKEPKGKLSKTELAALDLLIAGLQESGENYVMLPAWWAKIKNALWKAAKWATPVVTAELLRRIFGKIEIERKRLKADVPMNVSLQELIEFRKKHR
jgi:hypothetical protein